MEELFRKGVMIMAPSKEDPDRQVGVFNPEFVKDLQALRLTQLEQFRWLDGDWETINNVPATALNPAYADPGSSQFRLCEKDAWICLVGHDGKDRPHITFDPFSRQWIYLLAAGAYGILRSPGWTGDRIVFTGEMTMIGVDCYMRQTWTRQGVNQFHLINEERLSDGSWAFIDDWEFRRRA